MKNRAKKNTILDFFKSLDRNKKIEFIKEVFINEELLKYKEICELIIMVFNKNYGCIGLNNSKLIFTYLFDLNIIIIKNEIGYTKYFYNDIITKKA